MRYNPESLNDHRAFVEHLLSIIDTKLQYIEYHTRALITAHHSTQTHQLVTAPTSVAFSQPIDEEVFSQIESYSKTTRLLLIMRRSLCGKNSSIVYDLLSNDKYLDYFDKQLEKVLDRGTL